MSSTSGIRAGRAYVELGIDDKLAAALKVATARLRTFATMIRDIGAGVAAVSGTVSAALAGATTSFAATGSAAYDMSKRTGLSAQAVTELGYAAQQSGSDMDSLEMSIKKMQKTLGDAAGGSKAAIDTLAQLGFTVEDLAGMNPDEQFMAIAGGLANIQDPTMRAAAALDIFGRSGTSVLTMLDNGVAGLRAMRAEARELGATLSDEAAAKADRLGDAFDKVKAASAGVFNAVGEALANGYAEGLESIAKIIAGTSKWIRENQELVVTIAKVAAVGVAVGGVLVGVGVAGSVAFGLVSSAISAATAAMGIFKIGAVLAWIAALGPIGLVVAAVTAAAVAVLAFSGVIGNVAASVVGVVYSAASSIATFVGETFAAITAAMSAGDLALAAEVMWASIKVVWQGGVNFLANVWDSVLQTLETAWFDFTSFFRKNFQDVYQFIARTIANVIKSVVLAYQTAVSLAAKGIIYLQNSVGILSDEDTKYALADIDREGESKAEDARKSFEDKIKSLDEEYAMTPEERQKRISDERAKIGKKYDDAEAGRQEHLNDLIRQRQALLDKANTPAETDFGDPLADLQDWLDSFDRQGGLQKATATATGSTASVAARGSFFAADARGLGKEGLSYQERAARSLESIDRGIADLNNKDHDGVS